ncbi:MAG: SulP family inorganic anion transporter [Cyclobacteriaceae bacterium]
MNLRGYWSSDFPASVVVFLIALPLCLGIALASGAPLFSGVLAGIVGGIVVGSLSGSPLSVSGPAAGLTTIVAAAILDLGSFEAFLFCVVLAGIIQIILGFARAGSIAHFFPISVIKGMLAGIGLILILKQIPHAVGFDEDFEGDENFFQPDGRNTLTEIFEALNYLSPGAVIISAVSIILLVSWNSNRLLRFKFFRMVPAPLVVVFLGIILNMLFNSFLPSLAISDKHLVSVPMLSESVGLSAFFTFPDFSLWQDPKIYITALTLAIVASLETLLNIEACDKVDPYRRITPLNRELRAQGAGNLVSGLLGGLPVTSVIVRSSANVNAGARTKASAISHGIILLLSVLLIPGVLQLIPLSCLAGILLVTGYKLTKPASFKEMYKKGTAQFLPFIVTILAVTFTNLLQGVFLGIVVAIFFILKTNFQKAIIVVSSEENFLLKFTKDVSFLHKASLRQALGKIPSDTRVVIDGVKANFMDADILETITDFMETAKAKNIEVELTGIKITAKEL